MAQERARIVTDPLGRTKRRTDLSAIHQAGDPETLLRRRDEALGRIRVTREEIVAETAGLDGERAHAGDRWSVMHVLWHLAGRDSHLDEARRIVDEGVTELAPDPRPDDELRENVGRVLATIDEVVAFCETLTPEQLAVHARRANRDYYVIGMIESMGEHLQDHLDHIRQIKESLAAGGPVPA